MAMVLPYAGSVESYAALGKGVEFPRPDCPSCSAPMIFWHGYWRQVRGEEDFLPIWVRRARCKPCASSHCLLPSFLLLGRYDPAEVIGSVLEAVASATSTVTAAADRAGVPYTTARGWVRRFSARSGELAVSFAALAVELGGAVLRPLAEARQWALCAMQAAFEAACDLPGWILLGCFGFCSVVSGGRLIAANTNLPVISIGKRRFIAPVP